jgi:predicted metal-dependent TIM-barrel fold hydrolase
MLIDCHVHTNSTPESKENLIRQLDAAGVDRIILLSFHPASFVPQPGHECESWGKPMAPAAALAQVMD